MISGECKVSKEHILITLKQIRLNDPYFRLVLDFGLSVSHIQQIFPQTVTKIASLLQNLFFFSKCPNCDETITNTYQSQICQSTMYN